MFTYIICIYICTYIQRYLHIHMYIHTAENIAASEAAEASAAAQSGGGGGGCSPLASVDRAVCRTASVLLGIVVPPPPLPRAPYTCHAKRSPTRGTNDAAGHHFCRRPQTAAAIGASRAAHTTSYPRRQQLPAASGRKAKTNGINTKSWVVMRAGRDAARKGATSTVA